MSKRAEIELLCKRTVIKLLCERTVKELLSERAHQQALTLIDLENSKKSKYLCMGLRLYKTRATHRHAMLLQLNQKITSVGRATNA